MAIPSVVGTESGGRTGSGTVTVTPPAGADYWVAFVVAPEHTPPSGWSLVQSWAVEGEPVYWFYESTGAPGAVWTYSGLSVNDPVAVLVRGYSGVSGTAYASQHTATSPSLNATEDALAARVVLDFPDPTPLGYPTAATLNRAQVSQPDGTNTWAVSIGIAEQEVTAGATGTAAWTVPGQWEPHALTILLYGETDPPPAAPTDVTATGGDHQISGGFTADPTATQFRGQWRRTDLVRPSTTTQASAPAHLRRISQENLPMPSGYTYDFTGDGVPYAQFDSGCRVTHNEFGGRYVTGGSIAGPWNTDTAPNPPFSQGHGTGVAAMAIGATYGVAKDAILYSVNSGDEAGPTMEQYEDSAAWLIANKPANRTVALNISNGFPLDDIPRLEAFFDSLYLNGIAVFVAAGNTNDEQPYNAFQYRFFVVGASTQADVKASYSDYGDGIDLYAPISPTTTAGSSSNSATRTADGTSEASPTAAGVALKILEGNPELAPWRLYEVLRSQAFVGKISGIPTGPNRLLNGNANTDEWSDFPVDGDTFTLDGLDADATYEVRFAQMVDGEWSDWSDSATATTTGTPATGPTLKGRIGGSTVTFTGVAVRINGETVPVTGMAIRQGGVTVPLV